MAYDDLKVAPDGTRYTGAPIGFTHRWSYNGLWTERKLTPHLWKVRFEASKRRVEDAPLRSGAATKSQFHWVMVSWQRAQKATPQHYDTLLEGVNFLGTYQKPKWSAPRSLHFNQPSLRQRTISFLRDTIARLEQEEATGAPPLEYALDPLGGR